jgi:hypothetical protein
MRPRVPLLLLLLAGAARAADPPPPPADSIATAKADLQEIRSPTGQQEAAPSLPTLDMKDVGPAPGSAPPDLSMFAVPEAELGPDGLKKKKEGTGNWLVDAMDKNSGHSAASRGKEKEDILKGDPNILRDDHTGVQLGKDGRPVDEEKDRAPQAEPPPPVYNPLDSFMSGWISAKDHDLLLPASKGDGLAAEVSKGHSDALQSLELGPAASPAEPVLPGLDATALADPKQAPNPYLADVEAPPAAQLRAFSAPEMPLFSPIDSPDAPHAATLSGEDPRSLDTQRSAIPDFAQPSDDDKYFKQAKRF